MSFLSKFILKILKQNNQSILRKHNIKGLKFGNFNEFKFYENYKSIYFGKNISIRNNFHVLVGNNASLRIENNVFFNNFCSINCLENISIGENTLFGEGVKLYDHNHKYETKPIFKIDHHDFTKAPIKIGKNCWLGSNVIVLKGVTIGDNSIIGAGCIIHKDIPSGSIIINKQEQAQKYHPN